MGEALQLTNILLDWPTDVRRGRCHVPADWLAATGLSPGDADRPGAAGGGRALSRRLEALARAALSRVPDYLDLVSPRARALPAVLLLPALWALASLEHARRDPEFPRGRRRPVCRARGCGARRPPGCSGTAVPRGATARRRSRRLGA